MIFDINLVLADMLSAIKETVNGNWDNVKSTANEFIENDKERLQLLAELRISGDLPDEWFQSRMEDEKIILEAELNALEVLSSSKANQAVNAAFDVLINGIILSL